MIPNESTFKSALQQTPIAIVGMAAVLPEAKNLREYWDNIVSKKDCMTDVPLSRWSIDDYYDPDPTTPDKTYCKRGGFIPQIDFDPLAFGLPPNILEVTDVSQLLALVVAKAAMEDAGYGESNESILSRTGVILGVGGGQKLITPLTTRLQYPIWEKVLRSSGLSEEDTQIISEKIKLGYVGWEENSFPGMLGNVIAGRIANRLNLGGTNCVVDAACAASLSALKMAVSDLLEYRADIMITGGVDTDNSIFMYMSFSKTPAFSKQQNVRPFDTESDGMMVGEGIGMLVLKRLEDAERDHDRIYAVIKGIGSSSDGRYKSIYAPRSSGQALALRRAYQDAGMAPSTVGLIEAHGTGTMAGDPAEFGGLKEVFAENNPAKQKIALGSVKSQIGHTKAAAGAASLIKTALALHHKILPATINVTQPNPKLGIEESPFYLNTETRPWIGEEHPRRAGVSSFGFGGTNFHITLEEYKSEANGAYRLHTVGQVILLSADTPEQLLRRGEETIVDLQSKAGARHFSKLVESSKSETFAISSARVGFVAASAAEAAECLQLTIETLKKKPQAEAWAHPKGVYYRKFALEPTGKVVALFPGQGSQYLEMGRELLINFPPLGQAYSEMDRLFMADGIKPLSNVVFPVPLFDAAQKKAQSDTLQRTEHAQPAIGVFSFGLYKLLQQAGFSPDFVAGHSFGEMTALWAAGVLSDDAFFRLIKARGQAMAPPNQPNFDPGTMLAVKGEARLIEQMAKELPNVTVANLNSRQQIVLGGPTPAISKAQQILTAKGYSTVLLPVSAAFHTPLVAHAQHAFAQALDGVTFNCPQIPVYANAIGEPYPEQPEAIQKLLSEQILNPVLFEQQIENLYAAGAYFFVEVGPKRVLTNLVKSILGERPHLAIALNGSSKKDSDRQLREALAQLRVAGLPLQAVDPYQLEQPIREASMNRLTVSLTGSNYVSDKTKAAFEEALRDGHQVKGVAQPTKEIAQARPRNDYVKPMNMPSNGKSQSPNTPPPANTSSFLHTPHLANTPHPANMPRLANMPPTTNTPPPANTPHLANMPRLANMPPTTNTPPPANRGHLSATASAPRAMAVKTEAPTLINPQQVLGSLQDSLAQFTTLYDETLRVHEQFQKYQAEEAQTFFQLIQEQTAIFIDRNSFNQAELAKTVSENVTRSMTRFHDHQAETLRLHEQYLNQQTTYFETYFQLVQEQFTKLTSKASFPPVVPPLAGQNNSTVKHIPPQQVPTSPPASTVIPIYPPITPQPNGGPLAHPVTPNMAPAKASPPLPTEVKHKPPVHALDVESISHTLLEVVSQKTGYPSEMLELSMELESDLGIDSIKRVEILGSMEEHYPDLPKLDPEELAELRTLGQITSHIEQKISPVNNRSNALDYTGGAKTTEVVTTIEPTVSEALLEVVSQKTGYPAEMLELSMELESDLGIDSIKRVEILGSMEERYPDLPKLDPEELAELRTLGQITSHIEQRISPVNNRNRSNALDYTGGAKTTEVVTTIEPTVSEALLEVVSQKTGYPAEMLELSMELESDLGIDSIKRVEILGSMEERYPDLPKLDPEELAELRTLGQITSHIEQRISPVNSDLDVGATSSGTSPTGYLGGKLEPHQSPPPSTGAYIERRVVQLQSLPAPDWLDFAPNQFCLLTDDGSLTSIRLAERLSEHGWQVVVLGFPPSIVAESYPWPPEISRVVLSDMSEEHLKQQLSAILAKQGAIGAFIHVNPSWHESNGAAFIGRESEEAIVKHVFLMAKHLKPSLSEAAQSGRSGFLTVARLDGQFGLGTQDFRAVDGSLFGLTKSLNLEWESVFCRAIDLSPDLNTEQAANLIIAELHDPNRLISEVAYDGVGRTTLEAVPALIAKQATSKTMTPSSLFLVSGGARGITAECVIKLAQRHRCQFILVGRTLNEAIPTWAEHDLNEAELKKRIMNDLIASGERPTPRKVQAAYKSIRAQQEIQNTLQAIAQAGGRAEYVSADVSDAAALQQALTPVIDRMGAVTGLIHGAGVLADKAIENKSIADFEKVYSVKITGLQNLLACVPVEQLEHLVLFSSAAGFYGNIGQTDYAMANEVLNKVAYLLKQHHPTCHVLSINWGPWDGGMVTPQLKQLFAERQIEVIPIEAGTQLFVEQLQPSQRDTVQIVVGGSLASLKARPNVTAQTHRIRRTLSEAANPFLQDHTIGGHAVLPAMCTIAWFANTCEAIYPGFKFFRCENFMVLKGIVFDNTLADEYILDLKPRTTSEDEIVFEGKIWSEQEKGKKRYHYSAQLTLRQQLPEPPIYQNRLNPTIQRSEHTYYQDGTLFHGPSFQGVQRVLEITPERLTLVGKLPRLDKQQQGQFAVQSFNSYTVDVQFQSMLVWARQVYQAASLPLAAKKSEQFKSLPFDETFYVSLDVLASNENKLVANITTHNEQGEVYNRVLGAEVTISKRLNELFMVT